MSSTELPSSGSSQVGLFAFLLTILVVMGGCGGGMSEARHGGYAAESPSSSGGDEAADMAGAEMEASYDEVTVASKPAPAPPAAKERTRSEPLSGIATGTVPGSAPAPRPPPAPPPVPEPPKAEGSPEGRIDDPAAKKRAAPLLIYRAQLQLAVFETTKAIDATEKLALDAGGYLVRRDNQSITIRVPAGKFQRILHRIGGMGDVLQRNVSAEDVTDQFYDLRIRLRNAEAMRARLEQLLAKATTVKDALDVERELARVSGEIERLKGRLKLMGELIAFSTITVQFRPHHTESIDPTIRLPFPWLGQLGLGKLLRL